MPQVSTQLGVDLSEDVDEDTIVELLDGLARHELRDDRAVCVDLVLESCVEVLLLDRVWHDDQEKVEIFSLLWLLQLFSIGIFSADILGVVVVNGLLESFDIGLVAQLNDVSVVNVDVEPPLLRELVEAVVQVLAMLHILLEAKDRPLSEVNRLLHNGTEDLGVV